MLSHELLVLKGFQFNIYPEENLYEFETEDEDLISKILGDDYMGDENIVILQLHEDFSNGMICVDSNTWDITDDEFENIVNKL